MNVVRKGIIKLFLNEFTNVIHELYYIPELKNKLLSIGQLQEKGLAILIQGVCKIYHPLKDLIILNKMSMNKMFILLSYTPISPNFSPERYYYTSTHDLFSLFH